MIDIKKHNNNNKSLIDVDEKTISEGIRYILSHFYKQHELFPRTIMTSKTGGQLKVDYESDIESSINKIINIFRESDYYDCKINGFPYNTQYTKMDLDIKNRTSASFIMIDLDLQDFSNNKKNLDANLEKTLNNLSIKFHETSHPTVLWTGNGYHIYQPLDGIVFENYDIFYDFLPYIDGRDLTTEFIRFAEKFFTDGKSDPKHMPSIKSCLVRVPGTFNSKNKEQVKVIQKWDGTSPAVNWIARDFRCDLIRKRIDKMNQRQKIKNKNTVFNRKQEWIYNKIEWIEKLIQTSIEDHRKQCLWQILCPYLVNIRKLTEKEVTEILTQWLENCNRLRNLDFNSHVNIKNDLRNVRDYKPPSKEKLKNEYKDLYKFLKDKNIFL